MLRLTNDFEWADLTSNFCTNSNKYNPSHNKRTLTDSDSMELVKDFNIYPNPTDDLVNVEVELKDGAAYTIEMLDLSGRVIYSSVISSQEFNNATYQINTSSFENGIYFVNVTEGDHRMTKRLIITR